MSDRHEPGRLLPFRHDRVDDGARNGPMSEREKLVLADVKCSQSLAMSGEVMWVSARTVATATGLARAEVEQALLRLERRGLVQAAYSVRAGRPTELVHALRQAIEDNALPPEAA